jgi:DNA uptake protein ComE-like DNA-binding protein
MMKQKCTIAVCSAAIGLVLVLMAWAPKVTANAIAEFVVPAQSASGSGGTADLVDINSASKEQLEACQASEQPTRRRSLTADRIKRRRT